MTCKLESSSQAYGEQNFLSHTLKGETPEQDLNFFAQIIDSYGVIDFTDVTSEGSNFFRPQDHDINSDLMLVGIFVYTFEDIVDDINLDTFLNGQKINRLKLPPTKIPFTFPPGVILYPHWSLQVNPLPGSPKIDKFLIYWQPVNVFYYAKA